MDAAITDRHLARLPFFPLPGLVFFPGTMLPLHIFEPRYRAMIAWCLEQGSPLAVTCIREGHEHEQPGDPPVREVCGVGRLLRHSRTADGRYHVLLEGTGRVRMLEEHPRDLPFRLARAELLPDWSLQADLAERLSTLRALTSALQQRFPAASVALAEVASAGSPRGLVDGLAALLFAEAAQRQSLLECQDLALRLETVEERVFGLLSGGPDAADA